MEKVSVGRTVYARKVFDPSPEIVRGGDVDKLRRRFEREARVQAELSRDYFIPVYELQLDEEPPWILMALADRDLMTEIERGRPLDLIPRQALTDVLNALEELHKLGFVHRDLKPSNVLLHEGAWKLSDFGLVLPPEEASSRFTSTLSSWGTQAYCAPEQFRDFRSATPAADIYSFGCILHDVFVGETRVPCARQTGPGDLGTIIEKCTEQDPNRRFKTVAGVRAALLTVLSSDGPVSSDPTVEQWTLKLKDVAVWVLDDLDRFVRFVVKLSDAAEQWSIYSLIDESVLARLLALDPGLGRTVGLEYCTWARSAAHDFDYCDVIVGRLENLVRIGDLELAAAAAVAAGQMGRDHNRWYVMRRVVNRCGSGLESRLASRLAIEIAAEGVQEDFCRCAEVIHGSIGDYHPMIASLLDNWRKQNQS